MIDKKDIENLERRIRRIEKYLGSLYELMKNTDRQVREIAETEKERAAFDPSERE